MGEKVGHGDTCGRKLHGFWTTIRHFCSHHLPDWGKMFGKSCSYMSKRNLLTQLRVSSEYQASLRNAVVRTQVGDHTLVRGFCQQGAPQWGRQADSVVGEFSQQSRRSCLCKEAVSSLYAWSGGHVNYVSVQDHEPKVEAELTRLVNKGLHRQVRFLG